jgi:antibiotic biosynthesis monooxygenase (ABM) superfamily enzyme
MIVYRFESSDSLDAWLESPVRQRLMAEGADLITDQPREQVFAAVASDPGVRMVTSYLLKEGGEPAHREVHDDVLAELDNIRASGRARSLRQWPVSRVTP